MQNRFLRGLYVFVLALPIFLTTVSRADESGDIARSAKTFDVSLPVPVEESAFDVWAPENRKALGAGILMLVAAATGLAITVTGLKRDLRQRRHRYVYRSRRE